MKTLLDTSVLVASCVQSHPLHQAAKSWLLQAKDGQMEAFVAAHSLVETYSVLTRAPFQPRINAAQAHQMIAHNVLAHVSLLSLGEAAYWPILTSLTEAQVVGGKSYDTLILACAVSAQLDQLVTANFRDFFSLAQALDTEITIIGI